MKSSKKLYKVLAFSDWTQDRLADLMGVSTPSVNSWANGKSEPKGRHAEMIDEIYAKLVEPYLCELEKKADELAEKLLKRQLTDLPEDNSCDKM